MKKNQDVRQAILKAGVNQWQIAETCGISEGNFSRMLRKELSEDKKREIYDAIERAKKEMWEALMNG
jgi:predicted XRE-type DNA-binding protein